MSSLELGNYGFDNFSVEHILKVKLDFLKYDRSSSLTI